MAREPFGARAVASALLLDRDGEVRARQVAVFRNDPAADAAVRTVLPEVDGLDSASRLALLDLALPALDHLSPAQAGELARDLAAIGAEGARPAPFEWALQRVVQRRLAPLLGARRAAPVRVWTLEEVQVECLELLSAVAWAGEPDPAAAQRALAIGLGSLGAPPGWRLLPPGRVDAHRLDKVLARLDEAAPELKSRILMACAACALADQRVVPAEGGIVRAVAASLGCPVPPLVA